jgi:hypothetical protein
MDSGGGPHADTIDLTCDDSDEDEPPRVRQRVASSSTSAGTSSSAPPRGHWHPAVRAQSAGAQFELPSGEQIDRAGVSAKATICLDRLAVLYGSLRAAYTKGYRYVRTPFPPSSPNYPHHRNEFTLPGSSRRMSSGPFVRHLKELEARARGEVARGGPMPWFDDDAELRAAARARHAPFAPAGAAARDDAAQQQLVAALRASAADAEAEEAAQLEAALRASRQEW